MKRLCFIATGGTIAGKDKGRGLAPALTAEELLSAVPEMKYFWEVDCLQLMQLDSTNIKPTHWLSMAQTIIDRYKKYDGFIISHGTDTMAYTSAALYYMLENIAKPVVLTGSQLPIGHPDTDAKDNLRLACQVAASGRGGVYLAFDNQVIWGNRAKKMHSQGKRGFYSINEAVAGCWNTTSKTMLWQTEHPVRGQFTPRLQLDDSVAVLKLIPGTKPDMLGMLIDAGYRGIIIESFGAGGLPMEEGEYNFLPMAAYAGRREVVLVCTTQCVYDGVHMDSYEVGTRAAARGILSGEDATLEALTVRLMLALGESYHIDEVKRVFQTKK